MATINWPTSGRAFSLAQYDEGLEWNVQISAGRAGNVTTRAVPGIRWLATLLIPDETVANDLYRGQLEALLATLDGGENRLAMFNLARPLPNGTLTGSPTVSGSHAAGVSSIALANCNGTLLRGDRIGIAGQRFLVTADATPSGNAMTVSVRPKVRVALSGGAAVVWDKPTSLFIPTTPKVIVPYRANVRPGFAVELMEVWS